MRLVARSREASRRQHTRNREAPARFRNSSADDLFSAGGAGRADDRADRDREQGNSRPFYRRDGADLRRGAERSRAGEERPADLAGLARGRGGGGTAPDSQVDAAGVGARIYFAKPAILSAR